MGTYTSGKKSRPPKWHSLTEDDKTASLSHAMTQAQETAYLLLTERGIRRAVSIMRGFARPTAEERQAIKVLDALGLPDMTPQIIGQCSAGQAVDKADNLSGMLTAVEARKVVKGESWKAQSRRRYSEMRSGKKKAAKVTEPKAA